MLSTADQVKNSFIYLVPTVVTSLIPFLTFPVFTRIFTKEEYGLLALAQIYAILVSGISNFGLIIGFKRNFFQYPSPSDRSALLYSALVFVCLMLVASAVLTYLARHQLAEFFLGSPEYGNFLFLVFCTYAAITLKPYFIDYFTNYENAKANVRIVVADTVITAIASLVLVLIFKTGIEGLPLGQLVGSGVVLSFLVFWFGTNLRFRLSWQLFKECLKISYPLTPTILLKTINSQFDKYMIGQMDSVGGTGLYSIGQRLSITLFTFMTALQNVYQPNVYKFMFDTEGEGGKHIGQYLTPFLYVSIAAGVLLSLFAEEVVTVLAPKSYHGAIEITIILSMFYGILFFSKQPQLVYARKTHISSLLFLVSMALNIGINIPFIKVWGFLGAAWATFIAGLVSSIISFVISQYYYKIHWEYKKLAAIYFIFFLSSILMILMRHYPTAYYERVIIKILLLAAYVFLGTKLGYLSKDNYQTAKQMIVNKFN